MAESDAPKPDAPKRDAPGPDAPETLDDKPGRIPLTARLLMRETFSARGAAMTIAGFTVLITVAGGFLMRVVDHREYHHVGKALWFALQTVTTVGYGDVTPTAPSGRFIAAVIMLTGIGFLAVITASVTAALVENGRRRFAAQSDADQTERLDELNQRLTRIEAALSQPGPPAPPDTRG
jgi:voltage-gated potassium channel